jgi:hypothetical protein
MYVSYFEFKKILNKLEKEYQDLQDNPSVQTDKKFGFYAKMTLRRVEKEVKELITLKSKK